ncbi:EpsG family protein [Lelliottia wanjuensis]|uniref:EpsG family protein n=1 Tax=Lelliottia wanjuensis TaxID=3050585 RepID=UPI00254DEA16|nr:MULTISPECIES: EpsG family protein [unclassified Lelliottia]MDK9356977.1 EpsG family protein [Lelliottia sp. V106_16]MDK9372351.1 EpsG family protein [Lelliottia sp. V106_10]MDK9585684.1 EpsG family protein [Lelliottia sp. V86_10]MDK9599155.1 EpsG family protein [Lelliottia sp. V106_5]
MNTTRSTQHNSKLQLFVLCAVSLLLFLIAGFRPIGIDNDSLTYQAEILAFHKGTSEIKEPIFLLFCYINDIFFNESVRSVFVMYALFAVFLKTYAIAKYSTNILLSLLVYAGMFFILHDMTQIRVGLASAFFLLSLPDLIQGNKKKFLIKIFAACICHLSAIILLPLVLLSSKKINFTVLFFSPMLMLAIVLAIGDMNPILISLFRYLPEPLSTKAISYIIGVQEFGRFDAVNIFSKFTLSAFFFFTLYLFSLVRHNKLNSDDIIYLKLFSIMLSVFYLFSSVPVLASRSFELFAVSFILSFPAIASKFKPAWVLCAFISLWVCLYCYLVNLKLIGM